MNNIPKTLILRPPLNSSLEYINQHTFDYIADKLIINIQLITYFSFTAQLNVAFITPPMSIFTSSLQSLH